MKSIQILFLLILYSCLTAAQGKIIFNDSTYKYFLNYYSEIFFDVTKTLTIKNVAFGEYANEFRPIKKDESNLGYRKEAIWVKFTIRNESCKIKKWMINLNYGVFDDVSFFIPADNNFIEKKSGLKYPFKQREIKNHFIVFPLLLKLNEEKTFFLKVESGKSIPLNLEIITEEKFFQEQQNDYLLRGFLYGGLLILAIYNLFLFFSIKDVSYILYFFYTLSVCYYQTANDGLGYQFVTPDFPQHNIVYGILGINFLILFGSLFTKYFLQAKKYSNLLNTLLLGFAAFAFLYSIYVITAGEYKSSYTPYYGLAYFMLILITSIYCSVKGSINARYYIVALSPFIILAFFRGFKNLGILPASFMADYGVPIGMLFEMTILSFPLGNRINTIKQEEEKEKALIRSRIASDLHDEIGSNLSSISLSSQMIQRSSRIEEKEKKQLGDITLTAKETADSILDIIWFINPEHDKTEDLIEKMRDTTAKLLLQINYEFISDETKELNLKDLKLRRNLFLLYKEIINNIVKHSEAKNVQIEFRRDKENIILKVKDDGIGFNQDGIYSGNGLKNIKKRANEMGGRIRIDSKIDGGTEINLCI